MELSFKYFIVITSFFMAFAIVGFVLVFFAYFDDKRCTIVLSKESPTTIEVTGSSMSIGTCEAKLYTVANGTFDGAANRDPTATILTNLELCPEITVVRKEGQWSQIADWCMIELSLSLVVPSGVPASVWPADNEEARLVFDTGNMWPLPSNPAKNTTFDVWFLNENGKAMTQQTAGLSPGQATATMLSNGVIALTVVGDAVPLEPYTWEAPNNWIDQTTISTIELRCSGWYKVV